MMNDSLVRFPATCPACCREFLAEMSFGTIRQSLAADRPLKLYAKCAWHKVAWTANELERDQIREYADAVHGRDWAVPSGYTVVDAEPPARLPSSHAELPRHRIAFPNPVR